MLLSATSQLLTQLGTPRRWLKDDGYLPFTLSRSSSTGSLAFKEESYTPSSHSGSSSPGRIPSSSATTTTTTTFHWTSTTSLRRILFILFHTTLLAFGCFGIYMLIGLHTGKFLQVPVYSKYDIAQSGYFRPLITTPPSTQAWRDSPSTSHLSGTVSNHHTNAAEMDREHQGHAPQQATTPVDSWTFPSSSTPGSHQSPTPPKSSDQHLLILSPIRNAQDALPTYFHHLDNLKHPKSNTSIGFLLSDEEDETGRLVKQWVDEQASKGEYRHITLLRKDFGLLSPNGQARHKDWIQAQRRGLMGRARTLLLTSVINPTVDWVFWLDVDVRHLPSTIIQDLMLLGQIETNSSDPQGRVSNETETVIADIIVPNIMDKWKGNLRGYDLNSWAETPKSLEMKATLDPDVILHEGDKAHPTHRLHLAREWTAPDTTSDPFTPILPYIPTPAEQSGQETISNLYNPNSTAYIGRQIELDAVGGVATLVRASVHLFGAVFPSWNADHAIETEAFGVLAKLAGARIVGLPNYLVTHK